MSDKSDDGEPKLPAHWNKVKSSVAEPGRDYYFNTKNKKSVWTVREALLPKNNVCKRKPASHAMPKPPSETPDSSENDEKHQTRNEKQTNPTTSKKPTAPPFAYDFSRSSQGSGHPGAIGATVPPGWPSIAPQPPVFPYNPIPPNYSFPQVWNFPQNIYPAFTNTQENLMTYGNPQFTWPVNKSGSSFHQTPATQSIFSQNVNPLRPFEIAPTNQEAERMDPQVHIKANHNARQTVQYNQVPVNTGQSDYDSYSFHPVSNTNEASTKMKRSLSTPNLVSTINDEKVSKTNLKDDDLRLKLMAKRQHRVSVTLDGDTDKEKDMSLKRRMSCSALNVDDKTLDDALDTSKSETDSSNEIDVDHSPLSVDSYGYWLLRNAKPQAQPDCVYICIDTNIFICELALLKELVRRDKEKICHFLVPFVVHQELDCLKKNTLEDRPTTRDFNTRRRATIAMRFLSDEYAKSNHSFISDVRLNKRDMVLRRYGNDDEILNCCLSYQNQNIHVVLLTADVGLSNKAHEVGIPFYTAHKMKKLLHAVQKEIDKRDLVLKLKVTIPNTTADKSNTDDMDQNTGPIKLVRQIQNQQLPLVQHNTQPTMAPYLNIPPPVIQHNTKSTTTPYPNIPSVMMQVPPPVIVHATPPVILPATFDPTIPPPPFQYVNPYIPNHTFVRPVTSTQSSRSDRGLENMSTFLKTIGSSEKGGNLETQSMSSDTANSSDSFGRAIKKFPDPETPKTKGTEAKASVRSQPEAQRVENNAKVANTNSGQQAYRVKLIRKPVLVPPTQEKSGDKPRSKWIRMTPSESVVPKESALEKKKSNEQQQPAIGSVSSTTYYPSITTASGVSKSLTATVDSSVEIPESTNKVVSVKDPIVKQKSTSEDVNAAAIVSVKDTVVQKNTSKVNAENAIVSVKDPRKQKKSTPEEVAANAMQIPLTRVISRKLTTRMDEWTVWFEQIMDDIVTDVLMKKTRVHSSTLHVRHVASGEMVYVSDTHEERIERRHVDVSPAKSENRPHAPRLLQPPWSLHEALSALAECYHHEHRELSTVASRLAHKINESLKRECNTDKVRQPEKTVKVYYMRLSPKNPEVFLALYKEGRSLLSLLKDVHDKPKVEKAENNLIILLEELQLGKLEAKHDELSVHASVENLVEEGEDNEDLTDFRPKEGIDIHKMIIDYLKKHYEEWSQYQEQEVDTVQAQADKPEKNVELGVKFTAIPEFEAKLKSGNCGLDPEDEFLDDEEEWEDMEEQEGMDIDEYADEENFYEEDFEEDGMEISEKIFENDQVEEDMDISKNGQIEDASVASRNVQVEDTAVDDKNGHVEDVPVFDKDGEVNVAAVVGTNAQVKNAVVSENIQVKKNLQFSSKEDNCEAVNLAIRQSILNVKVYTVKLVGMEVPAVYKDGDDTNLPPLPGILVACKQLITCMTNINQNRRSDGRALLSCFRSLAPSFTKFPSNPKKVIAGAVRLRELVPDGFRDSLISMNQTLEVLQCHYDNTTRIQAKRIAKKIK